VVTVHLQCFQFKNALKRQLCIQVDVESVEKNECREEKQKKKATGSVDSAQYCSRFGNA